MSPADLDEAVSCLRIAENFDCELGTIFNTSGLHNTYPKRSSSSTAAPGPGICRPPCRLDYGTVELTTSRASGPFPKINPRCRHLITKLPRSFTQRDGLVFASGRTTGHSSGQLVGPLVVARLYTGDGLLVSETLEQAILPYETDPPGTPGAAQPARFAEPGDSGAFVFNLDQRVGIVWGGIVRQSPMSTAASSPRLDVAWPRRKVCPLTFKTWFFTPPSTSSSPPSRTS